TSASRRSRKRCSTGFVASPWSGPSASDIDADWRAAATLAAMAIEVSDAEALDAYSRAVTSVAERLAPSVANLRVARNGGGSAVVITPDGFLLTSAHVVAGGRGKGRASFVDGRELAFSVV